MCRDFELKDFELGDFELRNFELKDFSLRDSQLRDDDPLAFVLEATGLVTRSAGGFCWWRRRCHLETEHTRPDASTVEIGVIISPGSRGVGVVGLACRQLVRMDQQGSAGISRPGFLGLR